MNNHTVNELNKFLEGNYMAIHAYENYIGRLEDPEAKQLLQQLQQGHKSHASKVAERIQNLGGVPVDDVGIGGKMIEIVKKLENPTSDTAAIFKDALAGEQRGIAKSKEILDGDLDDESLQLVKTILDHDEQHVQLLSDYIH